MASSPNHVADSYESLKYDQPFIEDFSEKQNHNNIISSSSSDNENDMRSNTNTHINVQHVDTDGGGTTSSSSSSSSNTDDVSVVCTDSDQAPNPTKNGFSILRVRVCLLLITIFASTAFVTKPLLNQYLLDRWTDERGDGGSHYNNNNQSGSVRDLSLCERNESDPAVILNDKIESEVSIATMYYSYATTIPALISCLVFGALVDIVGRKPALISAMCGFTGQIITTICIVRFKLDTNFFYLAFALDGVCGSFFVLLIACFSVTADVSVAKGTRILGIVIITMLPASMFAAFNVVAGIVVKKVGYLAAFSVILGPVVLALFITIFFLPETMPMAKQEMTLKRVWVYTSRIVSLYTRDGTKRERWSLFFSLMIFSTGVLNTLNLTSTDALYQKHRPLCWDAAQLGYYSAARNAGGYIGAFIFLCICRRIACASDELISMIGQLFVAGSFVLEAFVTTNWQMYLVPIIAIPGSNVSQITRGIMSVLAGPTKQGVMFSSVALVEVLCSLASSTAYNKVYAYSVDFFAGFVYLLMAGMCVATFLLYIPFFRFYDGPPTSYQKLIQANDDDVITDSTPSSTSGSRSHQGDVA